MIKYLLVILTVFTFSKTLLSTDNESHNKYMLALKTEDKNLQRELLLKSLELNAYSKAPILFLNQNIGNSEENTKTAEFLYKLLQKNPDAINLIEPFIIFAENSNMSSDKYFQQLYECLIKYATKNKDLNRTYINYFSLYMIHAAISDNVDNGEKLLNIVKQCNFSYKKVLLQIISLDFYTELDRREVSNKYKKTINLLLDDLMAEKLSRVNLKRFLNILENRNMLNESIKLIKNNIDANPLFLSYSSIFQMENELGNTKAAKEIFEKLKKLPTINKITLKFFEAEMFIAEKKYNEATALLAEISESTLKIYEKRILLKQKDYKNLKSYLENQIKNETNEEKVLDAYNTMFYIYNKLYSAKELKEFVKNFKNNSLLDNLTFANNLSYILTDMNVDLNYAEELIKKVLKAEPKNSLYLDTLAWVYFKKNDLENAKKYILKAIKNAYPDCDLTEIFIHAGDIFSALNEKDIAKKYYLLALKNCSSKTDDEIKNSIQKKLK